MCGWEVESIYKKGQGRQLPRGSPALAEKVPPDPWDVASSVCSKPRARAFHFAFLCLPA